jgi:hypothetical protein
MYRKKSDLLNSIIAAVLFLFITTSARAAYFADYFPLTLGSWWQGEILAPVPSLVGSILVPMGSGRISVFESFVYHGQNAVKYGDPSDFTIASKSGNLVTIHAHFSDGEEYNISDFTVGNISDGTRFNTGYFTILLREFSKIPRNLWPNLGFADEYGDLVGSYLATPGLIFTVEFSTWSEPDQLNEIVTYGLSPNIRNEISTGVSSITFWAPGIGKVLEIVIDEETGHLEEMVVLTDYYIAPETSSTVLEGIVTDAITGLPVAGVHLALTPGSQALATDAIGNFLSGSISPGAYTVQVSAPHYYSKTLTGISLQPGSTHVMNVSLDPKAPLVTGIQAAAFNDGQTQVLLTARVTHPEGAGFLTSITADLSEIGGSPSQRLRDDGITGDILSGDGIYSFRTILPSNIPARSYTLTIKATDEMGFSEFGSILLNVIETVTGTVASNQSDTKTFTNSFAGQTLVISYALGGPVQTASSKKIRSGCTVMLTVSGPNGEKYGPYEVEDTIDISIPGASAGTWTYETENNCASTVNYQIQTKGSGTGLLTGRVLDGLSGKGLKGAQVTCDTGGSTQSLDEGYYTMVVVAGTGATVSTSKSGYQTNFKTGVVITTGDTTPLNIQVVPESSPGQPIPQGQYAYQVLDPSDDPNPPTQPFAAAVSGNNLQFKALFPSYQQPVDLYLGMTINYPGLSGRLFMVKSDNTIVELKDVLHPWRQGVTAAQTSEFSIPAFTSGFPLAPYTLYALVTPDSSTLSSYEMSYLSTTLAQSPPDSLRITYISNPSEDPDPFTQPLAAKVSADNLLLNVHFPIQEEPITIFLAYLAPSGELYLIKSDNSPEKFSSTLWPWRQNVQAEQLQQVISLPVSSIGGGNTIFYSMVTTDPTGFTKYDLIYFQKALQ